MHCNTQHHHTYRLVPFYRVLDAENVIYVLTGTYPSPQLSWPVEVVPCMRSTGGDDCVGLPFGQVRAAASVAGLTVYGASPGKTKLGGLRLKMGEAKECTLKIDNSRVMSDIMERKTNA